ncbi:MAG: hypothetical protein AB1414_18425 [bacterium]
MEICCFPQSISTYFYKFQSISIILSPYRPYPLIPFLTLLVTIQHTKQVGSRKGGKYFILFYS